MNLVSYRSGGDISISITNVTNPWLRDNRIKISGKDSTWVNGTLKKLEEIIESFQPQDCFIRKHKVFIHTIFAISIGIILSRILLFVQIEPSDTAPQWIHIIRENILYLYVVRLLIFYGFGYFPASELLNKLESFWPSVEIQIGPEHSFVEKKKRFWFSTAFVLGVLPLLINIIYDLMKALTHYFQA